MSEARDEAPRYVWFDTEFTTLDLERAHLLQVAMMVTDSALRRLGPPERDLCLPVRLPDGAEVSPWVEENLAGLLAQSRSPDALPPAEIDRLLTARLTELAGPTPDDVRRRPVLAGNSIHADWWMARRDLPAFVGSLHYRQLDVSSLKIEWAFAGGGGFDKENPAVLRQWFPAAVLESSARHDAYYDIQASAAELNYYRHRFLRTPA